ncbi:TPA: competence protein CoiA family protein [Vibrio parahaemolyticus]
MDWKVCLFDSLEVRSLHSSFEKDVIHRMSIDAREKEDGHIGLHCPACHHPVFLKQPFKRDVFAYHYSIEKSHAHIEKAGYILPVGAIPTKECMFRASEGSSIPNGDIYEREGLKHKAAVDHLYESLLNDDQASDVKRESVIRAGGRWRKPDVQAVINGVLTVFEFQMSWLTAEVISERESFYHKNGMRIIWLYCDDTDYWTFTDGTGSEIEGFSEYKTSTSTINRISVGSYIASYGLGALSLTYSTSSSISEGFSALVQAQPFFKDEHGLHLLQCYSGEPLYIIPQQPKVGLKDLYFIDECPLPIWWRFTTVRSITKYISKIKNTLGLEERDNVTQEYINKLMCVLAATPPPPEWFEIFYQLLISEPLILDDFLVRD